MTSKEIHNQLRNPNHLRTLQSMVQMELLLYPKPHRARSSSFLMNHLFLLLIPISLISFLMSSLLPKRTCMFSFFTSLILSPSFVYLLSFIGLFQTRYGCNVTTAWNGGSCHLKQNQMPCQTSGTATWTQLIPADQTVLCPSRLMMNLMTWWVSRLLEGNKKR